MNEDVAELYRSGLLRDQCVLGPVVMERQYPGSDYLKSHEVIQAALSSVDGLVAVYWDSDEYLAATFDSGAAMLPLAKERAEPIATARPIIRGLVMLHAECMLTKMLERVFIYR